MARYRRFDVVTTLTAPDDALEGVRLRRAGLRAAMTGVELSLAIGQASHAGIGPTNVAERCCSTENTVLILCIRSDQLASRLFLDRLTDLPRHASTRLAL